MPTVQSRYQEKAGVYPSQQANPVMIDGSRAGKARVGAGQINTPRAPKPAYLQYIPGPTSYGRDIGNQVASTADRLNTMAMKIADENAKNAALQTSAADYAILTSLAYEGVDGKGGILTKTGTAYLKAHEEAKAEFRAFIGNRANSLEPAERSYYLADATARLKGIEKQLNSKYLVEYGNAKKKANADINKANLTQILVSAHDVPTTKALISQAIATVAEQNGLYTTEDLMKGAVDQEAVDQVMLSVAEGFMGTENGTILIEPYIEDINAALSPDKRDELKAILMANNKLMLEEYSTQRKLAEELVKIKYAEDINKVSATLAKASRAGNLTEVSIGLIQGALSRKDGKYLAEQIKTMSGYLANPGETSWKAVAYLDELSRDGVPPLEAASLAASKGHAIGDKAMYKYILDYRSEAGVAVNREYRRIEKVAKGLVETKAGLAYNVEAGMYIIAPQGQALLDNIMRGKHEDLRDAYERAGRGLNGKEAMQKTADSIITDIMDPSKYSQELITPLLSVIVTNPSRYAPLKWTLGENANVLPAYIAPENFITGAQKAYDNLTSEEIDNIPSSNKRYHLNLYKDIGFDKTLEAIMAVHSRQGFNINESHAAILLMREFVNEEILLHEEDDLEWQAEFKRNLLLQTNLMIRQLEGEEPEKEPEKAPEKLKEPKESRWGSGLEKLKKTVFN